MAEKDPYDQKRIESENLSELMYDYDGEGNYIAEAGKYYVGHDQILLHDVLKRNREKLDKIRQQVIAGEFSPIVFFMEKKYMGPCILSEYTGISARKIKKHFKPEAFVRLKKETLSKYADAFEISVEELVHFQ